MKFNETEFLPVILGADITAYSHARSFHQEYGIKSLVLSMLKSEFIARSSIIENRVIEGLEKEEVLIDTLIKVGKEFEGKKKLIVLRLRRLVCAYPYREQGSIKALLHHPLYRRVPFKPHCLKGQVLCHLRGAGYTLPQDLCI